MSKRITNLHIEKLKGLENLKSLCEASHKLFHIYKDMGHRRMLLADEVGIVRRTASSSAIH